MHDTPNTAMAVLGPAGTFCDMAADSLPYQVRKEFHPVIDGVFAAVGKSAHRGIAPIENTLDGYVQRTLDLLLEKDVHIIGELTIPVHFSFVANAARPGDVHTVYVQFKANGQCRRFLEELGANIVTTESNMASFELAAQNGAGHGAIIPHHMLKSFGPCFSIADVTDAESNFTRFITLEHGPCVPAHRNPGDYIRMPLYILSTHDRPGMLYDILGSFASRRVNLISIMSRPTKRHIGAYNFYVELGGTFDMCESMEKALASVAESFEIKVLGMYPGSAP